MSYFVDLENNKVIGVKQVNAGYINPGNSIEIPEYEDKLLGTTYTNGQFEGYYITLTADKTTITANGLDQSIITARVYDYLDNPQNVFSQPIVFDVNGQQQNISLTNGIAQITLTSAVAGIFTVKTVNSVMRNGQVEVIAQ